MVQFKKVEFVLNGVVVGTVENTTLPDAISAMAHLNPIANFKMTIACYYNLSVDKSVAT